MRTPSTSARADAGGGLGGFVGLVRLRPLVVLPLTFGVVDPDTIVDLQATGHLAVVAKKFSWELPAFGSKVHF